MNGAHVRAPTPSGHELSTVARPMVADKTDMVVRVRAASVNTMDVKKAADVFSWR